MLARSPILDQLLSPGCGLRLVHGFSDRRGGVSQGCFASLNLGRKWGDDTSAVDENYRRVATAAGYDPHALRLARQVHGDAIIDGSRIEAGSEADGIWLHRDLQQPLVAGVLTADCVPILLADRNAELVAAVHSGWRGTVANIAGHAVAALRARGAGELLAAIGPCIEQDAFEVGPEVAEQFSPQYVAMYRRPHIDLVAVVRDQLIAAGVKRECIDRVGGCTHNHPATYFSYRRDGRGCGQQLSFIGWAPVVPV